MNDSKEEPGFSGEKPKRRRRWLLPVAAALAVAIVIGGVSFAVLDHQREEAAAEERAAERAAVLAAEKEERQERREQREREAAALAAKQQVYDECQDHLSGLFDALDEVDARLNVGLSQSDFSRLVGDASVAYNRINIDAFGSLDGKCLTSGANLEDALNAYTRTASTWSDCIFDYACDVDGIDPMLQKSWLTASRKIANAERLMSELDPANASQGGNKRDT